MGSKYWIPFSISMVFTKFEKSTLSILSLKESEEISNSRGGGMQNKYDKHPIFVASKLRKLRVFSWNLILVNI